MTATARRGRTRMRCRVSRSSRRTTGSISRASTSCARCAASIRVCPAGCTCIWATERRWRGCTPPPSPQPGNSVWPIARMKPRTTRNGARRAIGYRPCWTRARRVARVARERAEQLVREVTDLYGAGLERMLRRHCGRSRRRRPRGRRRTGGQPAVGARPAPARRRAQGRRRPGQRAALPRVARRRRVVDRSRRRCGAPAVLRQLQELPVLVGDTGTGGGGRGAGGRAGDRIDRSGCRRTDSRVPE